MKKILRFAVALTTIGFSVPALAIGPGVYTVKGVNNKQDGEYTGTLTIVQTSEDTFKLTWVIGSERYEGFAVGSAEVMAASFSGQGSQGVALLAEDDENKGTYNSMWTVKGGTKIGTEVLTPK